MIGANGVLIDQVRGEDDLTYQVVVKAWRLQSPEKTTSRESSPRRLARDTQSRT